MYDFVDRLEPEDVESIAAHLYVEMVRAGYTAVTEFHYLHHDRQGKPYDDPAEIARRLVAAARQAGIALTLVPVIYESGGFGGAPLESAQRRFRLGLEGALDLVERLAKENAPETTFGVGLHSLRAVAPDTLASLPGSGLEQLPVPVHIHVAEQQREVDACLAWSGLRPVEWLLENLSLSERWCLIHATHMTASEGSRVARSGATVGLCPTTEANLGDGLFRLSDFLDAGGRWGIGSDAHVSVDPAEELRWLEYGQRLLSQQRNVAAGPEDRSCGRALLEEAWSGGSTATGRPAGALEVGRRADLIVLDDAHPLVAGAEGDGVLDAWIFAAGPALVKDVMVGGRWRVQDRTHADEERTAVGFARALRRLYGVP